MATIPLILLLASAGGAGAHPLPEYEALEPMAKAWPEAPSGCHLYEGEVEQGVRLPIIGRQRADFTFTARLNGGVWEDEQWVIDKKRLGVNLLGADVFEGDEPMFGFLFANHQDELHISVGTGGGADPTPSALETLTPKPQLSQAAGNPPQAAKKTDEPAKMGRLERAAMKIALKQALESHRTEIEALGLEVDQLYGHLKTALDEGEVDEDALEALMTEAVAAQASASNQEIPPDLIEGWIDEGMAIFEANGVAPTPELGTEMAAAPLDLEAQQRYQEAQSGQMTHEISVSGFEEGVAAAQYQLEAEATPTPDGEIPFTLDGLLEVFDTDVEMQHVTRTDYQGIPAFRSERVLDIDDPWFSEPRVTGRFVTFQAKTLAPLHYLVEIAHPTRMPDSAGSGKIKHLKVELGLDSWGHVQAEALELHVNAGPFRVKVDHHITYRYMGPCETP